MHGIMGKVFRPLFTAAPRNPGGSDAAREANKALSKNLDSHEPMIDLLGGALSELPFPFGDIMRDRSEEFTTANCHPNSKKRSIQSAPAPPAKRSRASAA